jgi:hypothetical protein
VDEEVKEKRKAKLAIRVPRSVNKRTLAFLSWFMVDPPGPRKTIVF